MGKVRIGVSGWSYSEWRGEFYPEDLPKDEELSYAAEEFDTIEVNGTFYALTDPHTCRRWREAAPANFRYAVKGSRFITHSRRLRGAEAALANFFASGVLELGEKLGPILWQLPPDLEFDADLIDRFLEVLPYETSAAVALAGEHDDRVEEVSYGDGENHRLRHVLEFRHESFLQAETVRIARRHGTALCSSHSTEWPYTEEITAGFVYLRMHGPEELYASPYKDGALERWAERINAWHRGDEPHDASRITDLESPPRKERDVYVYFDNTARAHAPRDARRLREIMNTP